MSNIANQTTVITNARAVGSVDPSTQIRHGGIYYPAHMKNGVPKSARWEGMIALNSKPYTNNAGANMEGRKTFMRLVVWNGKNCVAGKGLADIFAKCVSVGKEISCNVRIESFDKRIFINGQPVLDAQGNTITTQAHNFIFEDKLIFGDDSNKVILGETSRWNGAINFDSRPTLWNVAGHADQAAWANTVVPKRMEVEYNGGNIYGYARVIIPEGAQLTNQQVQHQQLIPSQQGIAPTAAAAQLQMPVENQQAMVASGGDDTPL